MPRGDRLEKLLDAHRDISRRCNHVGASRIRVEQLPAGCLSTFPELVILGVFNHLGRCLQRHRFRSIRFFVNDHYEFTRKA